jgi:hypothetical protein
VDLNQKCPVKNIRTLTFLRRASALLFLHLTLLFPYAKLNLLEQWALVVPFNKT